MNDILDLFFQKNYTQETQDLIYKATGIFSVFTFSTPFGEIVDLISMTDNIESENVIDGVRGIVEKGIDKLLEANRIKVFQEATFAERIRILEGVFAITKIEDPTDYLPFFDGWDADKVKFSKVLGLVLGDDYEDFIYTISWVYEGTVKRLKEYLDEMKIENETIDTELIKKIRKNIRIFEQVFGSVDIVQSLSEINFIKGQPFQLYLNSFKDEIVDESDMEGTTYGLIWLVIVSSDGYNNPKIILMEEAKNLFQDINLLNVFNAMCTKAFGLYLAAHESDK